MFLYTLEKQFPCLPLQNTVDKNIYIDIITGTNIMVSKHEVVFLH